MIYFCIALDSECYLSHIHNQSKEFVSNEDHIDIIVEYVAVIDSKKSLAFQ